MPATADCIEFSLLQLSLNNHTVLRIVNGFISSCLDENGCTREPFLCPLSRVVAGTAVRIRELSTPPEISHRLRELGLCEQQEIKLVSRHTNIICQVCNARLGISRQLAESIIVEPIG
jgi:Fe2+ transport system protein FeoA